MMEKRGSYQNDVLCSALSGLLFFGLVIQYSLKKNDCGRSENEKAFVNSWCMVGNFMLCLLILFFLNVVLWGTLGFGLFLFLSKFFGFLILTIIVVSLPMMVCGSSFCVFSISGSQEEKKNKILSLIPLYSSYLFFSNQEDESKKLLKESQILLFFVWLSLFLFNSYMVGLVLFGIVIIKIILIVLGKDVFSFEWRDKVAYRFSTYPEEIFSAGFVFIKEGIALIRGKGGVEVKDLVRYQKSYGNIWSLLTWILTLVFVGFMCVVFMYWWKLGKYWKIVPIVWYFLRCLVFVYSKTKIPKLPVIAEVTA